MTKVWSPWNVLKGIHNKPYAVIILNRPINFNAENHFITNVWNKANLRLTVDGGTDSWLKWLDRNNINTQSLSYPDIVTGDMDSILPTTLSYFKSMPGIKIIETEDQNETDFTKAIIEIAKFTESKNIPLKSIIVFTEISGRFDQLISNINTLFKCKAILPKCKVFLLCPDSLTWLLPPGKHKIDIPSVLRRKQEWCALLPIGSACRVSTSGLKWNLDKSILEFGGMVSSSNTYNEDETVWVLTDKPIIWSMGIKNYLQCS